MIPVRRTQTVVNTYDANKSSIESRRDQGNGQFRAWQAKESEGLTLTASPDGQPRAGREDAVNLYDDFRVIEKAAEVDDAFNYIRTPAGQELGYEYFSRQKYDPYAVWGEVKGNDFHRFDELAELGWNGNMNLLTGDGRQLLGVSRIADEGITPEHVSKLREAHLSPASSEWTRDAMLTASDDTLGRIRDAWNPHNATDHYKAAVLSTGDEQKITRMNDCHESGLYEPELIEAVEFDKDLLLDLQEYTGPNQPGAILKLARNGHSPATVRAHGVSAAYNQTAAELAAR